MKRFHINSEQSNIARHTNKTVVQGEVEVTRDVNVTLTTILGSCVSVCMWDTKNRIGGMNHFLLAESSFSNNVKYGAYAMEILINRLLKNGADPKYLNSKVFGGALVSNLKNNIGQNNAEFALEFLQNEGIPCTGESVGGFKARKVKFHPTSGQVKMMFVQPTDVEKVSQPVSPKIDDITLF